MSIEDDSLICPITQEVFRDPVIAEDGRLYERAAITRWIIEHGTSPFTRQALDVNRLQPDEEVRKKAEQRRRLSVSYNRESDQIQFPSILPSGNMNLNRRTQTIYQPRRTIQQNPSRFNMKGRSTLIVCLCIVCCIMIPIVIINIVVARNRSQSSFTAIPYTTSRPFCYRMNYNLTIVPCLSSFTNLTTLSTETCRISNYRMYLHIFQAFSTTTNIIFAFQQSSGYWNIDGITLSNSNSTQNLFQNGDFETGSLSPHYRQCQSTGNISNSSQWNGRYCYSDGTQGQYGFLIQNVSTFPGSRYLLSYYLRNRNGSNSSFVLLLGR